MSRAGSRSIPGHLVLVFATLTGGFALAGEGCPPTFELWSAAVLPGGGAEVDLLRIGDGLGRFDRLELFVEVLPEDDRDRWFAPALAGAARHYRVERRTRLLHEEQLRPLCEALEETGLAALTPEPGCERLESMAATVLPTLRRVDLERDRGIGYRATRIRPDALPDCERELAEDLPPPDERRRDGRKVTGRAVVRKEVAPELPPDERQELTRALEEALRDRAAGWLEGADRTDGPVAAALLPTVREALGEKPTVQLGLAEPPDFRLGLEGSPRWLKIVRAAEALAAGGDDRDAALVTLSRLAAPDLAFELRAEHRALAARGAVPGAVTALRALTLADPASARAEAREILDGGEGPLADAALGVFVWTDPRLEARWAEAGPPTDAAERAELIEAVRAAAAENDGQR